MNRLLRLKHWQLFGLLIGVPIILQIILMVLFFVTQNPIMLIVLPLLSVFLIAIFFGWFYTLATNLHKKLPDTVNMSLTRFKTFLFIPIAYILFFSVFMYYVFNSIQESAPNIIDFAIILPLHLFSMFCIFYCLRFIAKALKTVELQRKVTFSDYAGEFFLIWFFPVGLWIIQPRINQLFDESLEIAE